MIDNMIILPQKTEELLLKIIEYTNSCGDDEVTLCYIVENLRKCDSRFDDRINTLVNAGYLRDKSSFHLTDTGISYVEIKRQYGMYTYWNPAKVSLGVSLIVNALLQILQNWQSLSQWLQSLLA